MELAAKDFSGRLAALDDAAFRARLVADAQADTSFIARVPMFWLGDGETPDYVFRAETSLDEIAKRAGEAPAEAFLRLCRASRLGLQGAAADSRATEVARSPRRRRAAQSEPLPRLRCSVRPTQRGRWRCAGRRPGFQARTGGSRRA
jgi:hypothetical protein